MKKEQRIKSRLNLMIIFIALLLVLTAQSVTFTNIQAQPITASTPFEQLAQGQGQQLQQTAQPLTQPTTATATTKAGTILLTTFPNGTSKAQFVNGTTVQILNGVGYLVLDPSASAAASASASAPVSNSVITKIIQQLLLNVDVRIINNGTFDTVPIGPDEQCLFDPSLPHCTPPPGEECPAGFGTNEIGQCFPLGGCPDGYHSNEDDETGTCYPDSEPCPEGQVRSKEGNYCIVPPESQPDVCDRAFVPEAVPPECIPAQEDQQPQPQQNLVPEESSVQSPEQDSENPSGDGDGNGDTDTFPEDMQPQPQPGDGNGDEGGEDGSTEGESSEEESTEE